MCMRSSLFCSSCYYKNHKWSSRRPYVMHFCPQCCVLSQILSASRTGWDVHNVLPLTLKALSNMLSHCICHATFMHLVEALYGDMYLHGGLNHLLYLCWLTPPMWRVPAHTAAPLWSRWLHSGAKHFWSKDGLITVRKASPSCTGLLQCALVMQFQNKSTIWNKVHLSFP